MLSSHEKNFGNNRRPERSKDPANNAGHVEYMKTLPLEWTEVDGGYELRITTDRGVRVVDYTTSTGFWKVRDGRGEGFGIPKMARYFHIGGFPKEKQFNNEGGYRGNSY